MSRKPAEFRDHPATFVEARGQQAYRAVCRHVVDGDTYDFFVDLGLFQYAYVAVRLNGIDTPEVYGVNASVEGQAAKTYVASILLDRPCLLFTGKDPTTFGRFVADILVWNGSDWVWLDALIREAGYAA